MPTSPPPPPKDDSVQSGRYKQFTQENSYAKEEGLVMMGCADGSPVVVRAVKPYGIRTQVWSATKEGTPPVFPSPAPDTADSTLMSKTYKVPLPLPKAGPSPAWIFQISGAFTYLERTPTDETTGFPGAKMPFRVPAMANAATTMLGLGGLGGGPGAAGPLILTPSFAEGAYTWPFTSISTGFADPTLSQTFNSDHSYTIDTLSRG